MRKTMMIQSLPQRGRFLDASNSDMPKVYSESELYRSYGDLRRKSESFGTVLNVPGTAYFYQDADVLITVFGVRGREVVYLVTDIKREGDAIYFSPSTIPQGSQVSDVPNSLIVSVLQMKAFIPELEKPSRSRFGFSTPLDRLVQLTSKGKYFFHSAKGRNFLATRVGTDPKDEPLYRVYEFFVELEKPLTLCRPVQ
jgi:hypothetical protein